MDTRELERLRPQPRHRRLCVMFVIVRLVFSGPGFFRAMVFRDGFYRVRGLFGQIARTGIYSRSEINCP